MPVPNNPYVGPRPFEYGQPLFGRTREVAELRYLLTSERIVLLYSPSGAGKSSLINAGLIPKVETRFDIWGPTRVNTEAPATAANRYVWSAIAGLAESESHTDQTLAEYAASCPRTRNPLLIFDQFEEILRVDPAGIAAKEAFFAQLGELLSDPTIWALFILREDYLAPLDPYVTFVPTHLQNRFRIDRLKRDTAAETILKPLEGTGRSFAPGVVDSLVANLATESSDYIEPLQLQVVCYDLWERMEKAGKAVIKQDDLGDMSSALRNYYDNAVARDSLSDERAIREWFETQLIAPDGVRLQVRGGLDPALITQLTDAWLIRPEPRGKTIWYELSHDRLIDPIRKSNAGWFNTRLHKTEILARTWKQQEQPESLLLTGADLIAANTWAASQPALTPDVVEFLKASRAGQSALDEKAAQAAREKQQAVRLRRWLITAIACLIVAVGVSVFAGIEYLKAAWTSTEAQFEEAVATRSAQIARDNTEKARYDEFLAGESEIKALDAQQTAQQQKQHVNHLLADQFVSFANLELGAPLDTADTARTLAYVASALRHDPASPSAHVVLSDLLRRQWWVPALTLTPEPVQPVQAVSWSPNGRRLLTSGTGSKVRIWDAQTGSLLDSVDFPGPVRTAAYAPDGIAIVAVTTGLAPVVWTGNEFIALPAPTKQFIAITKPNPVDLAWFSSDGTRVIGSALSQEGTGVRISFLWDLRTRRLLETGMHVSRDGHRIAVTNEIHNVDSRKVLGTLPEAMPYLVTGAPDASAALFMAGGTKIWQMDGDPRQLMQLWTDFGVPTGRELRLNSNLLFKPGTNNLLTLYAWNFSVPDPVSREVLLKHPRDLIAAVFGPAGKRILSACEDNTVRIWDVFTGQRTGEPLFHTGLNAIALSPDDSYATTAGDDGSAFIWSLTAGAQPQTLALNPPDPSDKIASLRFSPDNHSLVAISTHGIARAWNIAAGRLLGQALLASSKNAELTASISPGVDRVLTVFDKRVRIFDLDTGQPVCATPACYVPGSAADLTADGRYFLAQTDHAGRFYDFAGRPHGAQFALPGTSAALSPDGKLAAIPASGPGQDEIHFLNVETGLPAGLPPLNFSAWLPGFHKYSGVYFNNPLFTPDGRKLVVNIFDANIQVSPCYASLRVMDLRTGHPVAEMCHAEHIDHVALSPDGGLVATASKNIVQLWSTLTGARTQPPMPHDTKEVRTLAFSADGQFLITTAGRDTRLWDPATGKLVAGPFRFEFILGYNSVDRVAISPDSSLLAVAYANSIRVWNLKLGTPADATLLAEIAEVIGGYTLDAHGAVVATPDRAAKLRSLRRQAAARPPGTLTSYLRNLFHLSQ